MRVVRESSGQPGAAAAAVEGRAWPQGRYQRGAGEAQPADQWLICECVTMRWWVPPECDRVAGEYGAALGPGRRLVHLRPAAHRRLRRL